jgi:hypothetical protein
VADRFQVSEYNIEPGESVLFRNLFTKDRDRSALADKFKPLGPQVSFIFRTQCLSGSREGLAGATTCPNRSTIGPPCESKRVAPSTNAGEEVALRESSQVVWFNFFNAALIYFALCNQVVFD